MKRNQWSSVRVAAAVVSVTVVAVEDAIARKRLTLPNTKGTLRSGLRFHVDQDYDGHQVSGGYQRSAG